MRASRLPQDVANLPYPPLLGERPSGPMAWSEAGRIGSCSADQEIDKTCSNKQWYKALVLELIPKTLTPEQADLPSRT